jgi:predicted nuclease of predicted toxin-antitoxin system
VNPPKLLIDENLSPNVAVTLRAEGVDAVHVRDRGMNGASDAQVLDLAFREDRILVTSNVDDFVKLVRARELHAGLVLLEESGLTRQEQLQRVRRAVQLAIADAGGDMANKALRLAGEYGYAFEEIPAS